MKLFSILFWAIVPVSVAAQPGETVSLRWKLAPGEILVYNTVMAEQDIKQNNTPATGKDTTGSLNGLLQQLSKNRPGAAQNNGYLSFLQARPGNVVSIEMIMRPITDSILERRGTAPQPSSQQPGVVLRGSLNNEGGIESFYLKTEQKNLVAALFQLPSGAVKAGDTWPLEVNFLLMDQSFRVDTAHRRNRVSCSSIRRMGGEIIATLEYDIEEFASGNMGIANLISQKTMMKITYTGSAEFSVTRGRWQSYNAVMTIVSNGMMNMNSSKKISLEPKDSP